MTKAIYTTLAVSGDYRQFIEDLKTRVIGARISAARAVMHDAILLYWDIGCGIVEKQKAHGWGDSVVELVAADLRRAFPWARGFSANNVWLMRQFFSEYSGAAFLEHLVQETAQQRRPAQSQPVSDMLPRDHGSVLPQPSQILEQLVQELLPAVPWGHHVEIVKKVKAPAARLW